METSDRTVRVAVYGTGRWADRTHIPNLLSIEGVEIVALCDVERVQAFYHHPLPYDTPLSCSFNMCPDNGATMNLSSVASTPQAPVLAGWESARRGSKCLDVAAFMSG